MLYESSAISHLYRTSLVSGIRQSTVIRILPPKDGAKGTLKFGVFALQRLYVLLSFILRWTVDRFPELQRLEQTNPDESKWSKQTISYHGKVNKETELYIPVMGCLSALILC